jgi:hypothetical protein
MEFMYLFSVGTDREITTKYYSKTHIKITFSLTHVYNIDQ